MRQASPLSTQSKPKRRERGKQMLVRPMGGSLDARDKKEIQYRTITKAGKAAKNTPDIIDCRTGK